MPSIIKRELKSGTVYDVRFRIVNKDGSESNKRLSGFARKKEALNAYLEFMASYEPTAKAIKPTTVSAIYKYDDLIGPFWAYEKQHIKASSLYEKENIFAKYITPTFLGARLPFSKTQLYAWQDSLFLPNNQGKTLAHNTVKKIRLFFSTFLQYAEDRYDLQNTLKTVKFPKNKNAYTKMLFWEPAEFEKFIEVAKQDAAAHLWVPFFSVLYFMGFRIGELQALAESDYNGDTISISKSLSTKSREAVYVICTPKNEESYRENPCPTVVKNILNEYLAYKQKNNISSDFLFGGAKPIPGTTLRRKFSQLTALAGVTQIRIHDLRHSFASLAIHLGIDIMTISSLMGHADTEQLFKTYGHFYKSSKTDAVSKMNQFYAIK